MQNTHHFSFLPLSVGTDLLLRSGTRPEHAEILGGIAQVFLWVSFPVGQVKKTPAHDCT